MKKTNQLFAAIAVLLLFCATGLQAQEKYITVTQKHWDLDKKDFKMLEENLPEGCFVDFDFRIIDIFKKQEEANKDFYELIKSEYLRIKDYLKKRLIYEFFVD